MRRDGQPIEIHAREAVLGDVLLLSSGDLIAADARILTTQGALVDRSVLTGEALPEPAAAAPDLATAPLAERRSMVYAGTSIVGGSAEAVVVATGRDTEVGHISGALGSVRRRRSPVLVVNHDIEVDVLRRAGFEVSQCAGPIGGSECPVLHGMPCW